METTTEQEPRETVAIGTGYDSKRRHYWSFRPVGSGGRRWFDYVVGRLPLPHPDFDVEGGRVVARGSLAVHFADELRKVKVVTMGESDT